MKYGIIILKRFDDINIVFLRTDKVLEQLPGARAGCSLRGGEEGG